MQKEKTTTAEVRVLFYAVIDKHEMVESWLGKDEDAFHHPHLDSMIDKLQENNSYRMMAEEKKRFRVVKYKPLI